MTHTLVKGVIGGAPIWAPISLPFHKAVLAPRSYPLTLPESRKVPQLSLALHHLRLLYFLRAPFVAKLGQGEPTWCSPWPAEASTWPTLPLCQSQGKGRRKFSTASSRVVLPRAHYQAGATECGAPVAHPCLMEQKRAPYCPCFPVARLGRCEVY